MSTASPKRRPPSGQANVEPIAFRLDADSRRLLEKRAASLRISSHQLAKLYVISELAEPEQRMVSHEVMTAILHGMGLLRDDLATVAEGLLVASGNYSAEEAHQWVVENFTQQC